MTSRHRTYFNAFYNILGREWKIGKGRYGLYSILMVYDGTLKFQHLSFPNRGKNKRVHGFDVPSNIIAFYRNRNSGRELSLAKMNAKNAKLSGY